MAYIFTEISVESYPFAGIECCIGGGDFNDDYNDDFNTEEGKPIEVYTFIPKMSEVYNQI